MSAPAITFWKNRHSETILFVSTWRLALCLNVQCLTVLLWIRSSVLEESKYEHATYRPSMIGGYLFTALVDTHLVLGECNGNDRDTVRRCREMRLNQKSAKLSHFLFFIEDSKKHGHNIVCDRMLTMLTVRVRYVMHRRRSGSERLLKKSTCNTCNTRVV
jgi:hypothetical protein